MSVDARIPRDSLREMSLRGEISLHPSRPSTRHSDAAADDVDRGRRPMLAIATEDPHARSSPDATTSPAGRSSVGRSPMSPTGAGGHGVAIAPAPAGNDALGAELDGRGVAPFDTASEHDALSRHNAALRNEGACDGRCGLADCRAPYFDANGLTVHRIDPFPLMARRPQPAVARGLLDRVVTTGPTAVLDAWATVDPFPRSAYEAARHGAWADVLGRTSSA